MLRRLIWLLCLLVLTLAGDAGAAVTSGQEFLGKVDAAVVAGTLTADEALLLKFQYVFDQEALPSEYRPVAFSPLKCATDMIREFELRKDSLPVEVSARIKEYLTPPEEPNASKATYNSLGGHFTLTYYTSGTQHAVPATDVDPANGIPDYVEKIATYLDYSWEFEIDTWHFFAPPIGTGRYQVSFESMSAYGYTTVVSGALTRIVMHNNFVGFPPNDDPEGNVWGAAKVTAAHEFKHASQRPTSNWSEGGWVEVDATWMEDMAYDYVNDYYNYLPSGSPVSSCATPLDFGGTGSYEDCVWQIWMSETWGIQMIVDFWLWRSGHQGQAVIDSYEQMLINYGTTMGAGWLTFTGWNYACGARTIPGFGYEEAVRYPTGSPTATATAYPYTRSGAIQHLAANWIRCNNLSTQPGVVTVNFNGNAGAIRLAAVIRKTDGTGVFEPIALDANNDANTMLSVPRDQIAALGFTIANATKSGTATIIYSLTVDQAALPQPAAEFSATYFQRTLEAGQTDTDELLITNSGEPGSSLTYTAVVQETPGKSVPWLEVDPSSGAVPAGESDVLTLSFDATGMSAGTYFAFLVITHNAPGSPTTVPIELTVSDAVSGVGGLPGIMLVRGNHPNPFNPATTIVFALPQAGPATLEVFDMQGRLVRTLWRGELAAGSHEMLWNGRDDAGRAVPSGGYLARLGGSAGAIVHKMMLTK